jgi:hypothetical protein
MSDLVKCPIWVNPKYFNRCVIPEGGQIFRSLKKREEKRKKIEKFGLKILYFFIGEN